jgi:ferrous iron transport protein A
MLNITELKSGDRVKLVSFGATNLHYRRRLLSLGMTRGVEFSVIRVAPLGCPVQIEMRGTSISLRKDEASELVLERL